MSSVHINIHTCKIIKTEHLKQITVTYHSSHHDMEDALTYINKTRKFQHDVRIVDGEPDKQQITADYTGYTYNDQYVVPKIVRITV